MKKLSTKNVFASIMMLYLLLLFLDGCQKEIQTKDMAGASTNFADSGLAQAKIVYTDINPYTTRTGIVESGTSQTYNLDVNNDGTTDFMIEAYTSHFYFNTAAGVEIFSLKTGEVARDNFPPDSSLLAMNHGDTIRSNLNWVNTTSSASKFLRAYANPGNRWWGNWTDSTDHYLGLKIKQGTNTYYGWVRLGVSVITGKSSVTIKDYAYNSIPNKPILAGQMK
jgi:hypothetical protein